MKLLALDLGSTAGWATWDGAALEHGTWDMNAWGSGDAARLDLFSRRLSHNIQTRGITEVHAEEPFAGAANGRQADVVLIGQQAFAMVICRRLHEAGKLTAPLRLHNPLHIKTACLGWTQRRPRPDEPGVKRSRRGMIFAKAQDVLEAVVRRHPDAGIRDPNAAIAVAILDLVRAEHQGTGAPGATALNRALVPRRPGRRIAAEAQATLLQPDLGLRHG